MIKDEIENKIQLETININKTIANKRRGTKSKEKKKKAISIQTTSKSPYMRHL